MNNQSKTAHLLIDKQNMEIIHHDQITPEERQHRNSAAEKVGEIFLVWLPVVFSDLYNAELSRPRLWLAEVHADLPGSALEICWAFVLNIGV